MSTQVNDKATAPRPIGKAATLSLDALVPSASNREARKDEDLRGLATSIRTVGLIYPLVVRPDAEQEGVYRIIAGERRWRAMKILKLESAPCIVLSAKEDEASAEVLRVVENHQRRNLAPLEEAAAVRGLLDLGLEPEAVARSLGRSRAWVARRASLTELSERWLVEVRNEESKISTWLPSHLEVISRFPADVQDRIRDQWGSQWQWNVPAFRDLVDATGQFLHILAAAPWKPEDETLSPEAGACNVCPKRSSHAPDLFAGELDSQGGKTPPGDRCLDFQCWGRKAELFLTRKAEELRKEHPELILLNNGEQNGVDFEEAFQTEVLNAPDVAPSRKSDGNAVPALVINGPGLGRVKWVQPVHDEAPTTAKSGRKDASSNGDSGEKSIEEKRKPYDKRRRQIVIEAVKAKLETLAAEIYLDKALDLEGGCALAAKGLAVKTLALLAALLSDRGWLHHVQDGPLALPEGFVWNDLNALQNHQIGLADSREAALQLCWDLLRLVVSRLAVRLSVSPGEPTNEPHYAEVQTLCEMFDFDLIALRAQAASTIPYAKLWCNEVTDDWAAANAEVVANGGGAQ